MTKKNDSNEVVSQSNDQIDMAEVDYSIFNKNFLKNKYFIIIEANNKAAFFYLSTQMLYK